MRRTITLFLILLCLSVGTTASLSSAQTPSANSTLCELPIAELRAGDLLFAVNRGGNAITQSTTSPRDLPIDHVGIVCMMDGQPAVIEAAEEYGVTVTQIDSFLKHNPECIVGRVDSLDTKRSIDHAMDFLGLPYDSLFDPDNREFYCSELVQKSFVDIHGNPIFSTIPMSFHDSTGTILPYWTEFYRRNGRKVPEGEPGTNPAQLAKSEKVKIIFPILY